MTVQSWSGMQLPYRRKLLLLLLLAGIVPAALLGVAAMLLHIWQVRPEADTGERIALKLLYGTMDERIANGEKDAAGGSGAGGSGSGFLRDAIGQLERESGWKLFVTDGSGREWIEAYAARDVVVYDGVRYTVHVQASVQHGLRYTVLIPQEKGMEGTGGIGWQLPVIAGGCLLLGVVFVRLGLRSLYGPLHRLLERLPTGEQGQRLLSAGNELKALDAAFQRMDRDGRRLRAALGEQMPFVHEQLCRQLIHGESDERSARLMSDRFGYPPERLRFCIGIVCADDEERFAEHYGGIGLSVIHGALRKELEQLCGPCMTLANGPGQWVVVRGAETGEEQVFERFCEGLDQFRLYAAQRTRFVFSSAASDVGSSYERIGEGYRESSLLLRHRLLIASSLTITSEDIRRRMLLRMEESRPPRHLGLVELLLEGDANAAAEELADWLELVRRSASSPEHALAMVSAMLEELDSRLESFDSRLDGLLAYDPYARLHGITSWRDLCEWLRNNLLETIVRHVGQSSLPRPKRIVRQVETYLQEQYEEPLSLQITADRFGLTPSLLSRMFKETTGSSFSDYLLDIRMNKAMEWLAHTDWPLQHISDRLCYSTVQNFSRMFKKMAGMPPGEYRRQRQEERRSS